MEQTYRSRLNALPLGLKEEIAEYVLQWGMTATNRRLGILETFKKYNVKATELGTGTNRLIVKLGNYALKIALDDEGIDDNRQEWAISELLAPNVPATYEISGNIITKEDGSREIIGGHLLVADYAPAFANWGMFLNYQHKIRKILAEWDAKGFILGDVGTSKKNYANWGLLRGRPVCIDYAYVFPGGFDLFECICGCKELIINKSNYSSYRCAKCQTEFSDSELRSRISNQRRHELFSKVEGITMKDEYEVHNVDIKFIENKYDHIPTPYELSASELAASVRNVTNNEDLINFVKNREI